MVLTNNFPGVPLVTGSQITVAGSNVGATGQPNEPNHAGVSTPLESVWQTWRAPDTGQYLIHTFGSNFDTVLGVYTGPNLNNLTTVASNDDYNYPVTLNSGVTINTNANTLYRIAVDGYAGAEGSIALNIAKLNSGDAGNNAINGNSGSDWIRAGAGNDTINGNGGYDVLFAEDGNDVINGGPLAEYIDGGSGNDQINGNGGEDVLLGRDGNDRINGSASAEYIDGGLGNDIINGNGGRDTLIGGNGNDTITGGAQADRINGGAGDDTIRGNGGADIIDSGVGQDTVFLGAGNATVALNRGAGFVTVNNFQPDQTRFSLGFNLSASALTFNDGPNGARILADTDLLAVVSNVEAATFSKNPNIFV